MGYTGDKKREYQLNWLRENRKRWIDSQGALCAICGETEKPFEVDHVDPNTKVSHRVWSWSKERREAELAKCQLLCIDCHWKKTGKENANEDNHHGTTEYRKGCRCEVCRNAHSNMKQRWRAMRKAKGLDPS